LSFTFSICQNHFWAYPESSKVIAQFVNGDRIRRSAEYANDEHGAYQQNSVLHFCAKMRRKKKEVYV
jgi:hypothetical protein